MNHALQEDWDYAFGYAHFSYIYLIYNYIGYDYICTYMGKYATQIDHSYTVRMNSSFSTSCVH